MYYWTNENIDIDEAITNTNNTDNTDNTDNNCDHNSNSDKGPSPNFRLF